MSDLVKKARDFLTHSTNEDYEKSLKWHKRWLGVAREVSTWSKDPSSKIGAVIVDPSTNDIVSTGYNGFPPGMADSKDRLETRDVKLRYVVHAEANAILRARCDVRGFDMYTYPTLMMPNNCPDCAKTIATAGIKRVFYFEEENVPQRWEELADFTKTIYAETGVQYFPIPKTVWTPFDIADLFEPGLWNDVPQETKDLLSRAYKQMKS